MYLNNAQFKQAFDLFAIAAQSGDPKAFNMLGRAYERAWGVSRSVPQAVKYFKAAAEQNYGWAYFNLADLYLSGDGLPPDPKKAFRYYAQAACLGVNKALNMLGILCENGIETSFPDKIKARQYFQAGANAQDCWAAFNVGRLALEEGDFSTACYWFNHSITTGFPEYWMFLKNYFSENNITIQNDLLNNNELLEKFNLSP